MECSPRLTCRTGCHSLARTRQGHCGGAHLVPCPDVKLAFNQAKRAAFQNIKAATQIRQSQPCSDRADSTDSCCPLSPGLTSHQQPFEPKFSQQASQQLALPISAMMQQCLVPPGPHLTPAPIWAERAASPPVEAAPPRQVVDGSAAPADEVLLQERRC